MIMQTKVPKEAVATALDEIILKGTTRAYTEANRQLIKKRMQEIINGVAKTFSAKIVLNYKDGYPPVINNDVITKKVIDVAKGIVGDDVIAPYLSMGGEDFSYFANIVPGCFFFLGTSPKDREPMSTPQHCSHFDIDEDAMLIGSSIFVELAYNN